MKPAMTAPTFEASHDGEHIRFTLDCSPMTAPHVFEVCTRDLAEVCLQARARQLGADGSGDL